VKSDLEIGRVNGAFTDNLITFDGVTMTSKFAFSWMEQRALKIVNNCLNTNFYSYLETSGGQSYDLYLNVVHFMNTSLN